MNWEALLNDNSIEYVTSGPNTKRGEVSVKCPWCGDEDPSQHMGISLSKEAWACYRNAEHRGKSPLRLIQALLGCTMPQARLTLSQYRVTDPDSLEGALAMLQAIDEAAGAEEGITDHTLKWPIEFRPIRANDRFASYLLGRGYSSHTAEKFNLKCADTGRYKDRIIFPLYLPTGLVGWTGRAIINPVSAPRYMASSPTVKKTVYGLPEAQTGDGTLFIVEGPFDALRINAMNYKGARAVALMGTSVTIPQYCIINGLKKQYRNTVVWLDNDAQAQTIDLSNKLANSHYVAGWSVKDPASSSCETIESLINSAWRYGT